MAADDRDRESRRRDRALTALFAFAVALLVVAPLTRRGWLLLLDWVPGPRQIGSTGGATFPTGPLFWWPVSAMHTLFGAAVGWLPIAIALAIAAAGGAQLMAGAWPARIAAGVAYAWNPFVYDRIAVGQLSVLAGYALLPWLLHAALRARSLRDALIVGAWWSVAALCTVHFAWIGGVLVLAVMVVRGRELELRKVLAGFLATSAVACVAITAGVFVATGSPITGGDGRVLTSFATRGDPSLGRSLGLLAEQGFWRAVVARPRDDLGAAFPFIAGMFVTAAIVGLFRARRTARAPLASAVALAGGIGWVLAHGGVGPFGAFYRAAYEHVPGFAVMREAQKWDALVCLALATGLGCLANALVQSRRRVAAWAVFLLPIALAPTLAWGLSNRIAPARAPSSWVSVRTAVDRVSGPVVALPFEQYPSPVITGGRTIANLAEPYFGDKVVTSRDPRVGGLRGDSGRRAAIAAAIAAARADVVAGRTPRLGAALAHLGYRAVLVVGASEVALDHDPTLRVAAAGDHVALWVVTGPA